jgi:tetratricopeptide (TPR) repeat protein
LRRRNFLLGFTFPWLGRGSAQRGRVDGGYHLEPHYRSPSPIDALLRKVKAGSDDFVTEVQHDRTAAVLSEWSAGLLKSPRNIEAIERCLAAGFAGSPLNSAESTVVRPGPSLEVRQMRYPRRVLERGEFVREMRSTLSAFSSIMTAEFQITRISGPRTRVRYELVGAGARFHREQRIGWWELEWDGTRITRWMAESETRSRSAHQWYADVASHAFGSASSWSGQMLHGVDYWRTVLDGASGIDVYGHHGVSVGDIDGDGFDDLYVCQPAGLPNRLYRNRGDGSFEDITDASGVGLLDNTACALFADFDNDGRQDLIVVRASGPLLFLNEGGGKFRAQPDAFQFANTPRGTFTGAAVADYDRDGWLDIYFCLYTYYQGANQYNYPVPYYAAENGPPNFLMRNQHDGTFRDVTKESGLDKNNTRFSFCCGWGDFNGDGWPDLYVVNDFGRKNLYRNNGDGTFTDVAAQTGAEDTGAGMGIAWFDYDNDGAEDLYVADMWSAAGERISSQEIFQREASEPVRALYRKHAMGNSLLRNRGDATFDDVTARAGCGMGRWSWSGDVWDFDHDGYADLYIANGMLSGPIREDLNSFFWRQVVANSPNEARPSLEYEQGWSAINELIRADYTWSGYERNVFYANNRDGTFSDVSGAIDLDFLEDGRAFACADFDHDGRLEVLLKSRNAPQMRLLKNVVPELPPSIAFRLRGRGKSNPDAIGAVVTLGHQTRRLQAGSGFLSQHTKELHFGLGQEPGPVSASIAWPSGTVQHLRNLPTGHRIWVEEGVETPRMEAFRKPTPTSAPTSASAPSRAPAGDPLPATVETWLLAPVPALSAPRTKPGIVTISTATSDEEAAVYNLLYRHLFDRRRDLTLPTSFLLNETGEIVKVYHGPVRAEQVEKDILRIPKTTGERLALALPFHGNAATYSFGRNHLSLGSIFFQRGYLEQSETFFRRALRDDPLSAEAHYGLGSVYLQQNKTHEARASFQQAVKLNAGYPDTGPNAWNNLGLMAAREGRSDEAIGNFQEALRLSPDYWTALENLGNAYRQQGRWTAARAVLERAVAVRPQDPEANYSLAMVFAQTEDTARAEDLLNKALRLRPIYPEALNNLGILYLRTRRREEAVAKFEECIRVSPGFDQSYLSLARVYSLEGERDKARAVLAELLRQHPEHAQARQMLDQLR